MHDDNSDNPLPANDNPYTARPHDDSPTPAAQYLAIGLAILAGLIRLIPHPWNFAPVHALGLFGGARLRLWQALVLPFAVMGVTDVIMWYVLPYWPAFNPWVYGCLAVTVLLGLLLRRTKAPLAIGGSAVAASLLFFLVTNFGVWFSSRVDPQTVPAGAGYIEETEGSKYPAGQIHYADNLHGLMTCYYKGLNFSVKEAPPLGFTGNAFAGDLFFTGLLFGAYGVLARRVGRRVATPQAAGSRP